MGYVISIEKVCTADGGDVGVDGVPGLGNASGTGHAHHHASACGHQLSVLIFGSHMEDTAFHLVASLYLEALLILSGIAFGC